MKQWIFACCFYLTLSTLVHAQVDIGVKGGANLTFFNENQQQFGEEATVEVGYFGGFFIDIPIDERFHIQPEVLYKGVGEFEFLNVPVYAEYDVANNVSLLAGPSLNYFFDFFSNKFKVRADISVAYHFSEGIEANLKYTLGLEELSPNVLFLGVGFSL